MAAAVGELRDDTLLLAGIALVIAGLAFKASVAPFHQWTPDVYEGAPTPITAFMAVATKAAAFGVLLRLFDVALIGASGTWAPALAALAAVTIVIGNVGAIGQSSLKRLLAYSSVAQAGYMLAGVVVSTRLGIQATIFYLAGYLLMNMAAFAVITARERESEAGDDISSLYGLGADRPALAWPMTIAMLSLAGFPATVGFFGKLYLIQAAVDNEYAWLGVVIVLGSAISLVYYLRVIAAVWMRPASDAGRGRERARARRAAGDGGRLARGRRRPSAPRPVPARREGAAVAEAEAAAARAHAPPAPARGGVRRRAVRARHGGVRDLPRAALRPRPRRGRGDLLARLARAARPGANFRGARRASQGAWHLPLTRTPPPARARSSTSGCSPSWPRRSPWPRRRRGWRGCRRRSRARCAPACASSPATSAGRPTPRRPGSRRARCPSAGAAAGSRSRCSRSRSAASTGSWSRARSDGSVGVDQARARRAGGERRPRVRGRPAEAGRRGRGGPAGRRGRRLGVPGRGVGAALPRRGDGGPLARRRRWPVAWRSGEAALATSGWAGLGVLATGEDGRRLGGPAAGIEVAAESAIGARIARGATTLYLRAETSGARTTGALAGLLRAGPAGPVVAEYTRDARRPARARLPRHGAGRARAPGRGDRRAARSARPGQPRRGGARCCATGRRGRRPSRATSAAAIRHAVRAGTVERSVYAVDDGSRSLELAARLGAEVGIEAGYTKVDRRLVEASAWTAGSHERAREDCVA